MRSRTYHSEAQDLGERRRHVNVLSYYIVGSMYGYLVLGITLPPGLLADDPDACASAWSGLGGFLGYDEFET